MKPPWKNKASWSELPELVLEKIYKYLDKVDQCSVSLVCHNWKKVFGSPSLWNRLEIPMFQKFTGVNKKPCRSENNLVKEYGHLVQHLKVKGIGGGHVCKFCTRHSKILKALSMKTQLSSLAISNIAGSLNAILKFLPDQKSLKYLEIKNSFLLSNEIPNICSILFDNCSNSLKDLRFDHVEWDEQIDLVARDITNLISVWKLFLVLENLQLEFNEVFEMLINCFPKVLSNSELFEQFYKSGYGNLEKLKLTYRSSNNYIIRDTNPDAWRALSKSCPKLKLEIFMIVKKGVQTIPYWLFPPYVPIRAMYLERTLTGCGLSIKVLLHLLLEEDYSKRIKKIIYIWPPNEQSKNYFQHALKMCPVLKSFDLHICYDKFSET